MNAAGAYEMPRSMRHRQRDMMMAGDAADERPADWLNDTRSARHGR